MPDLEDQLRTYGTVLDRAELEVAQVDVVPDTRSRTGLLALAAAAVVIVIAVAAIVVTRDGAPRSQVVTPPTTTGDPLKGPAPTPILAIGDSVMVGATDTLKRFVPGITVDGNVSRQFQDAPELVREYGPEFRTIVVALGANGPITQAALDDLYAAVGDRRLVLVTNRMSRAWTDANNALLHNAVQTRRGDIVLLDWHKIAEGHDDWFVPDGLHLRAEAQFEYAAAIAGALGVRAVPELTLADTYKYEPFEGNVGMVEAAGDVWIATHGADGAQLERRNGTDGTVVARVDLPFAYGVHEMAASDSYVWINGMVSDAGPLYGIVRVDVETNKIGLTQNSNEGDGIACACRMAATDDVLAIVGNGGVRTVDVLSGAIVGESSDGPTDAMTAIGGRIYAATDEPPAVQAMYAPGQNALIELPGAEGEVTGIVPAPDNPTEMLIMTSTGQVFRQTSTGETALAQTGHTGVALATEAPERVWSAGGHAVRFADGSGPTIPYAYSSTTKTFALDLRAEQPTGFDAIVATEGNIWLREGHNILRVRVDE